MRDAVLVFAPADRLFARHLNDVLLKHGYTMWARWEETTPSDDTWVEIFAAIESADNVLVVISPDATVSETVRESVEYAARQQKRLVPIVRRDANAAALNPALQRWQRLLYRENDDFHAALQRVMDAIDEDQDYVRAHTRLLVRSREWEINWRKPRNLLRGADLRGAEAWQAQSASHAVRPIERQTDYILASRRAAQAAQRSTLGVVIAAFVATVVLAGFGVSRLLSSQPSLDPILIQTQQVDATALALTASGLNSSFQPDLLATQTQLQPDSAAVQQISNTGANMIATLMAEYVRASVPDEMSLATQARSGELGEVMMMTATHSARETAQASAVAPSTAIVTPVAAEQTESGELLATAANDD
jgi:hypothetical protein